MSVTKTSPDWQILKGTTLDGGYELKDIVEAAGDRAVLRVRVLGDYSLKAVAAFYVMEEGKAEEQAALWQSIRAFDRKSHVSVPLGAGKLRVDGTAAAYAVYQVPDETLRDGLEGRSLTPEEATDLVRAIAGGLAELHGNGYVHGQVSPEEVRALGERVEISSEAIRRVNTEPLIQAGEAKYRAPESGSSNITIAADVWALGATIFESLTRKKYEPQLREEAAGLKHPLGTLLEGCLDPDPDKRLKLADFEAVLRSKAPLPKPKPVVTEAPKVPNELPELTQNAKETAAPEVESPKLPSQADAKPFKAEIAPVLPKPVSAAPTADRLKVRNEPTRPVEAPVFERQKLRNEPRDRTAEPPTGFSSRRGWLYAVGAFIVVVLILLFIRSHARQSAQNAANATPPQPVAKQPAWETKTLSPDEKTGATAQGEQKTNQPVPAATANGARTIWRLVLYTYRRQQDAQKKVEMLASQRPDLHVEVFEPGSGKTSYLVVAGGQMSREEAARMRLKAVREGMPHDSYIQNYNH